MKSGSFDDFAIFLINHFCNVYVLANLSTFFCICILYKGIISGVGVKLFALGWFLCREGKEDI